MRKAASILLIGVALAFAAAPVVAQKLRIDANDPFETALAAQKGKRVTLRLQSGWQELTGIVRNVTGRMVRLGALVGREFFDAVVPLTAVEAVIVRTKE